MIYEGRAARDLLQNDLVIMQGVRRASGLYRGLQRRETTEQGVLHNTENMS